MKKKNVKRWPNTRQKIIAMKKKQDDDAITVIKKSRSEVAVKQFLAQMHKVDSIILELKAKIELLDVWKSNIMEKLKAYVQNTSTKVGCNGESKKILSLVKIKGHHGAVVAEKVKAVTHKVNGSIVGRPRRIIKATAKIREERAETAGPAGKVIKVCKSKLNNNIDLSIVTAARLNEAKKSIRQTSVKSSNGGRVVHFQCKICNKRLTMLQNAKLHVCRVHFDLRLGCQRCGAKFYDYKLLRCHKLNCDGVNGGNKPITSPAHTKVKKIKVVAKPYHHRHKLGMKKKKMKKKMVAKNVKVLPRQIRSRRSNVSSLNNPFQKNYDLRRRSSRNGKVVKNGYGLSSSQGREEEYYQNVIVRNPFQNFDLKQTLSVKVRLERLVSSSPPPPSLSNIVEPVVVKLDLEKKEEEEESVVEKNEPESKEGLNTMEDKEEEDEEEECNQLNDSHNVGHEPEGDFRINEEKDDLKTNGEESHLHITEKESNFRMNEKVGDLNIIENGKCYAQLNEISCDNYEQLTTMIEDPATDSQSIMTASENFVVYPSQPSSSALDSQPSLLMSYGLSTMGDMEINQIFGHVSPTKFTSLGLADIHSRAEFYANSIQPLQMSTTTTTQGFQHYSTTDNNFGENSGLYSNSTSDNVRHKIIPSIPTFSFVTNGTVGGDSTELYAVNSDQVMHDTSYG